MLRPPGLLQDRGRPGSRGGLPGGHQPALGRFRSDEAAEHGVGEDEWGSRSLLGSSGRSRRLGSRGNPSRSHVKEPPKLANPPLSELAGLSGCFVRRRLGGVDQGDRIAHA
jgi:hypothetical protein